MGVADLEGCLSRMLLQCLARLGLDTAARASDHTVRSNSALKSVLLLLKRGETKGGNYTQLPSHGTHVPSLTSVPRLRTPQVDSAGVWPHIVHVSYGAPLL